jgi:hypothetical protein
MEDCFTRIIGNYYKAANRSSNQIGAPSGLYLVFSIRRDVHSRYAQVVSTGNRELQIAISPFSPGTMTFSVDEPINCHS